LESGKYAHLHCSGKSLFLAISNTEIPNSNTNQLADNYNKMTNMKITTQTKLLTMPAEPASGFSQPRELGDT